jgi:DNA polymerase III delta prime subunit
VDHKDKAKLVKYLSAAGERMRKSWAERKAKGLVEMSDIPRAFPIDTEVVYDDGEDFVGGVVKTVEQEHSWMGGTYWSVKLQVVHAIRGIPGQGLYQTKVRGFNGLMKMKDLPLRVPTKADMRKLEQRGARFAAFCQPGTYLSYKGELTQPSWWSSRTYRADGRIVVDPVSMERTDPETWRDCINLCGIQVDQDEERARVRSTKKVEIAKRDYWRCVPFLYGFSLAVKQWGRLDLEGMTEIKWRDDAWEKLVLDPEEKDLIYSLVKFHGGGFTDIIEGKGGGCIFLLHGNPGWGKTASAEAVAELLHKPLYSVGVGELGTDTLVLEKSLRQILDVATIWDAVILLDEADIFLEKRDEHNIVRNAMVGVFLRLLEYHNGVLFLTTNRVTDIDEAFYSRISVALHYRSDGKAEKIWTNLLGAAGLEPKWAGRMAKFDVNGRQIKNAIRMAQTLARAKDRKVRIEDLERSAAATIRFQTEMAASRPKAKKAASGE